MFTVDGIPGNMRLAITEAYSALFEDVASTATHRTKRVIRELFPQLAGRWDSVAVDGRGNPILTMGHKQQTFIEYFERNIRNNFFHNGENQKFEPGVARIAYGELKMDNLGQETHKLDSLKKIIKMISDAHANEYNADLNGLSYSDLEVRFGATVQQADEELKKELKSTQYTPSDYIIEEIPDFETAKKFYEYTNPSSRWCLTYLVNQWDGYTSDGLYKVYFAYKPNFKDIEPNVGETAPLDEYGLSLISIIVTPWESLRAVTTRWNHSNGGSDQAMNARELSNLLGGNVFELCPPPPKLEQQIVRIDDDSIKIGDQIWLCHNLQMPEDPEHGIWSCYGDTYFTWNAAMRAAKEYGHGWRLPSLNDVFKLMTACGGDKKAGTYLKSTTGWNIHDSHGENGADIFGFNAKPTGGRLAPGTFEHITSYPPDDFSILWTSETDADAFWTIGPYCMEFSAFHSSLIYTQHDRDNAYPVRLVKDAT